VRAPILLISDRTDRYLALRRRNPPERAIYVWKSDGGRAPEGALPVRGDPASPATYRSLLGRKPIVVIDLVNDALEARVARAVSATLGESPVLVIGHERNRPAPEVLGGVTWVDEDELFADAIDLILRRVSGRKRVAELRTALGDSRRCAFLVQNDPDPDAIASALALRTVLGLEARDSPIVTCGSITRPENKRLIAELGIRVRHVSGKQLDELAPLVLVDVQPPYFRHPLPEVAAVIDHHPPSGEFRARYRDIRTSYGASATIAAEYLLADGDEALTRPLATALLYGIITDTKSLSRSASDDDLQMFAHLFLRADHDALRRIQHPSYTPLALKRFGKALERVRQRRGLVYIHLGRLPADQEHIVAQLAEFCLGVEGADVAAVSGTFAGKLVMSTRALWPEARLNETLRDLFAEYGSAGGHPVMAKAVVKLRAWRKAHPYRDDGELEKVVRRELERRIVRKRGTTIPA
jgi:nanoRNase/pAp phosphatase (c-di-AMP/oligoRNAs hydrolase)